MKGSRILTVKKVFFRKGAVSVGFLITGLFSIVLAILAWFGANTGNFIIVLDKDGYRRGIMLCTEESFGKPEPRLYTSPIGDVNNISYDDIQLQQIKQTDGAFYDNDSSYLAYTFYMKNNGVENVDVQFRIYITETYRNADEAIRVLLIEDDEQERLFQKPDNVEHDYGDMPPAIHFVDNVTIVRDIITDFKPGDIKKFCIVIWLEGKDPDCIDDILGGMIKMRMRFDIMDEE